MGNGHLVIGPIVKYGGAKTFDQPIEYNAHLLLCTLFSRIFLLGVSMNSGFIGGMIFPLITVGIIAGVVCQQYYPTLPLGLTIGCFMTAIPGAVCPMPFTLTCLTVFTWYFGLYQTAPIYISCVTSYIILCGSGFFKKLAGTAQEREKAEKLARAQEAERKRLEQENANFAVNQYSGKIKNTDFQPPNV